MDSIDIFEILVQSSRRFAILAAVVFLACFGLWPQPTFNVAWAQALKRGANTVNLISTDIVNVHCTVRQKGWTASPTLECKPGQ